MASNSGRKSGSSGRSSSRNRVVIGASETTRVRYDQDRPQVESERKRAPRANSSASAKERAGTRTPKVSSAGRKVASQKRDDRDKRRREISRRRALAGVLVVIAVAGVVWGLVALWRAPLFTVDTITVTGNVHLSRNAVLQLAAVPPDATLLRLPDKAIVSRIETSPWVASASVRRSFPHTLDVTVSERTPIALVDAGVAGSWMVSSDGHWVAKRAKEPTGTLIPVRDVPGLNPQAGARISSAELSNALAVISGISGQLKSQTKFVSAATIEKTMIVLKNDVQIFVGPSEDIAKKDVIARGILSSKKDVVYVNVRVTDRPTWRGLAPAN
jgi:cell division protein FtsQ